MLSSRSLSYGALNDVAQRCSAPRDLQDDSEDRCIIHGKDVRRGWRQWLDRVLVGTLIIGAFATAVATFAGSQTLEPETQRKDSFARSVSSVKDEEAEVRVGGSASMAPLDFSALNFYHIRDGQPGQAYPWLKDTKVIEPHRETILTVSNPSEEHNYRWVLRVDETDEVQASVSGTEVAVILTQLDEHVITLEEVNPAGLVTRHLEETVIVKYVRREIRTLTEVERGELLDSVSPPPLFQEAHFLPTVVRFFNTICVYEEIGSTQRFFPPADWGDVRMYLKIKPHLDLLSIPRLWGKKCQNV